MRGRGIFAAVGALAIASVAVGPVFAAPAHFDKVACGNPRAAQEAVFLAQQRRLLERKERFRARAQSGPSVPTSVDGIAIVEATDEVLSPPRPFDLAESSITITPERDSFRVAVSRFPGGAPLPQEGIPLDLEDDDFKLVQLPFEFPYYGSSHDRLFVNSDGNLTFVHPEASSWPRSYQRAAAGPARIAPLFRDLDPSRGGSVRVAATSEALTVAWHAVPLFTEGPVGDPQTFQVTIQRDGGIEFRYGEVNLLEAVVGLFGGQAISGAVAVDWSSVESMLFDGGSILAEVFMSDPAIDEVAMVRSFYRTQEDAYDTVIIFNDLDMAAGDASLAHAYTVRNEVRGINEYISDYGRLYGSPRRLSAFVNMGALSDYPASPAAPIRGLPYSSMLTILAHEVGHRFLAYTPFKDPETGELSDALLGRQFAHWSFFLNSSASVLEGNAITDNGEGTSPRFETTAATQTYSLLDQYLMGLRDPSEVPPTFLVTNPTSTTASLGNASRTPEVGVEFDGVRKEIRVEDIIEAVGPRRPDTSVSQRQFRQAFVLLVDEGVQPKPESLRTLRQLRRWWLSFVDLHLEARASSSADLVRMLHLSTWPAGGLLVGCAGPGQVMIAESRDTDLVVNLRLDSAIAEIPSTVTIPAGEVSAEFEARGLESGTATLTAEAAETGYDRLETRLVVRADATELSLEQLHIPEQYGIAGSPLGAPLEYRVRDENLVPYSGVELAFTATGADAAELPSSRTDASGRAQIDWPLASSAGQQTLTASISGAPDSSVETQAVASENPPAVMAALTANAASGETTEAGRGFARGSLVTIYGNALATGPFEADTLLLFGNPALPVDLGLTSAHVAGVAAPLVKVSTTEITFQLPFQIPADTAEIVVSSPFGRTDPVTIPLGPAQPGIFPDRVSGGARAAVIDPNNPGGGVLPRAGGLLEIYGTGFGAVSPPGRTGRPGLSMPRQNVVAETEAWVDEQPVTVTMSALASFEAGVYVVTLDLPADLEAGDHTVKIAVGGQESNSVAFESE
ncbi:MAG: hypothetical protein OXN96_07195 [Bryobacterales bacterium]|nr:hypothetical protein [Bryobacterales bacterium]